VQSAKVMKMSARKERSHSIENFFFRFSIQICGTEMAVRSHAHVYALYWHKTTNFCYTKVWTHLFSFFLYILFNINNIIDLCCTTFMLSLWSCFDTICIV